MPSARRFAGTAAFLGCLAFGAVLPALGAEPDNEALIRDALRAAPPAVASTASVMDWDHKILKQGSGAYTCMPSDPGTRAKGGYNPMCLDQPWMAWLDAYVGKKPFQTDRTGIAYMLAGDTGASNIDPYAKGPTADNQWVAEGPHIMVLFPSPAQLEGLSTDPDRGGAYVMWKGTPYAHVMVPVAARPPARQ
jgi:hypothetical protein